MRSGWITLWWILATAGPAFKPQAGAVAAQDGGLRIWGQVTGIDERGLPHAELLFDDGLSLRCDGSGNFAREGLAPGPQEILVRAEGHLPRRVELYIRRSAFVPLSLPPARDILGLSSPREAGRLAGDHPALAVRDLDGDGLPERLGVWPEGPGADLQRDNEALSDPWGGDYFPLDLDAGLSEEPFPRSSWAMQAPHQPGFFWNRSLDGGLREADPADTRGGTPGGPAWLRTGAGSAGRVELGGGAGGALGRWDHLWASFRNLRARPAEDRSHGTELLKAEWLHLFPGLLCYGRLRFQEDSREWGNPLGPASAAVPPMALQIREQSRDRRERALAGGFRLPFGEELRIQVELQARLRQFRTVQEEWDWLVRREYAASGDSLAQDWFPTRRDDSRRRLGLMAGLESRHRRGRLLLGFYVEQHLREFGAAIDASPCLGAGRDPWFDTREETLGLGGRIRDIYQLGELGLLDLELAGRYSFYEFRRLRTGLFQRAGIPRIRFSEDLLSLEPRIAWRREWGAGFQSELAWGRRRSFLSPAQFWDPGSHPEDPAAWPLISAAPGEEAGNSSLLRHPEEDLYECALRYGADPEGRKLPGVSEAGLRACYALLRDEVLPWVEDPETDWTPRQILRNAGLQHRVGLDLWLSGSWGGSINLRLATALRGGRHDPVYVLPAGAGNYVRRYPDGGESPWQPRLSSTLALSWRSSLGSGLELVLAPGLRAMTETAVDHSQDPSLRLPAAFLFDLDIRLTDGGASGWEFSLKLRNIGNRREPIWLGVDRRTEPGELRISEIPRSGRRVDLGLVFRMSS